MQKSHQLQKMLINLLLTYEFFLTSSSGTQRSLTSFFFFFCEHFLMCLSQPRVIDRTCLYTFWCWLSRKWNKHLKLSVFSGRILWTRYNTISHIQSSVDSDISCSCSTNATGDSFCKLDKYQQRPLLIQWAAMRGSWRTFANTHQQSNVHMQIHARLRSHTQTHSFTCRLGTYELSAVINGKGRWPANSHGMTGHIYTLAHKCLYMRPRASPHTNSLRYTETQEVGVPGF